MHQYNPELVKVESVLPTEGVQIGGEAGGGFVTVQITKFDQVLEIPFLNVSLIKCRFGPDLEVRADKTSLQQTVNPGLKCMPPENPTAGDVEFSVSLNDGQHWLESNVTYTYR